MFTDLEIAQQLQALYANDTTAFDRLYVADDFGGVCWAHKIVGDVVYIYLRGSETPQDWVRDIMALPVDTPLGKVHHGFWLGMEQLDAYIGREFFNYNVIVAGHSLGAARAEILAGLLKLNGRPNIIKRVTFGEPQPAFNRLAMILHDVPGISYRAQENGQVDLVTTVPLNLPPLFSYCHPTKTTRLEVVSDPKDKTMFKLHHMGLYVEGLVNTNKV